MPEHNDASVSNAWFGTSMGAGGAMFIRLYNASSSQGNGYGRIWLEPRPYGFNGTIWKDLYQSQYKYYGSDYQNTFSNSTHTWVYCRYFDQANTNLLFKYNITLSWEFPMAKITPQLMTSGGSANISSMIRFDLTRFTFTKALVPNITEPYSYSSPASPQNVTLINTSNRGNWDSNYLALYDSSHNKSLIFSWQYRANQIDIMEDNSTGKFEYLYVTFDNKTQDWTDGYVTHNSTFVSWTRTLDSSQNVTQLKSVFSRYANMSLAQATAITVQRSSISNNTFSIQTNFTYSDLTNAWSITPTHYSPCFVHTTASSYIWKERSAFGTIYFVQNDSTTGYIDLHQGFYPNWLKYVYDNFNWLDANRWLDLSVGGAWSKIKTSDIYMYDHVQVLLVTCWLYEVTQNASLLNYIRDGADWIVSVMHSDGNVTFYFDQNGAEKRAYRFCTVHHALAFAYEVTANLTYLTYAEANANYETQNDLWMHNVTDYYHTDNEIMGFTKLHTLTANATYKTWAQAAIKDIIAKQDIYLWGWFGTDISSSSHVARGIFYYLDNVGNDIFGYDLELVAEKYLDASWVQRDDWSGQLYGALGYLNEYIKYPCHNEFALTAFERYAMYLVGKGTNVPRIYLDLIYENLDWVFGDNELSTIFENNGAVKRSIQLNASCVPYMFEQYQTYDQANLMWSLIWMHELYEDIVQTEGQYLYSTTAYLDARQTYFNYSVANPFILSTTQNLTTLNYSNERLTLTISAASGTISTTRIYCGSHGEPITVTGATSWNYDSASKICTITVIQSSSQEAVLDWAVTIPGDVDGDGDVDRYDCGLFAQAYGTSEGDPDYDPNCDFDNDGDIDRYDAVILAQNYGQSV